MAATVTDGKGLACIRSMPERPGLAPELTAAPRQPSRLA
jgi:hypothetical protein